MNDETYGQNEPPEPEDLDMNADDEIGDDNDNDDNTDELPPEEDIRYGRFNCEACLHFFHLIFLIFVLLFNHVKYFFSEKVIKEKSMILQIRLKKF